MLQKCQQVFGNELGVVNATLHIDAGAKSCFCKARKVPFVLQAKVDKEYWSILRKQELSGQFNFRTHVQQWRDTSIQYYGISSIIQEFQVPSQDGFTNVYALTPPWSIPFPRTQVYTSQEDPKIVISPPLSEYPGIP